jgi:hypothetical protein
MLPACAVGRYGGRWWWSVVRYLIERYGMAKFLVAFKELKRGAENDDRFSVNLRRDSRADRRRVARGPGRDDHGGSSR